MMKAIFIAYNQAYYTEIIDILEANGCRGYTMWENIEGRGSKDGEPHLGSHAWPAMNNAMLVFAEDERVGSIMDAVSAKDSETPELGLRAFVWNVEKTC